MVGAMEINLRIIDYLYVFWLAGVRETSDYNNIKYVIIIYDHTLFPIKLCEVSEEVISIK